MIAKNCIDCKDHEILPDPDPHDWFCDDDVKVVCKIIKKNITVACRPYNTRKECKIPKWCPKTMKLTKLMVMPDFSCSGIWTKGTNRMVEFEDLNLPKALIKRFENWIEFYEHDCHTSRNFHFKKNMAKELNNRGMELAKKLKKYLPCIRIFYKGEVKGDILPEEEITGA